jgi:hypothetical protein
MGRMESVIVTKGLGFDLFERVERGHVGRIDTH